MSKNVRSVVLSIAVIAVIAGGWLLFRDRLSGAAEDLQVGDCFDVPTEETIKSIQHQPCTDPHDGEVFVVGTTDAESYPIVSGFGDWAEANCLDPAFANYVGESAADRLDIDVAYLAPTRESWEDGDREITCYLTPADGVKLTTSYRAAPAAS